MEELGASDTNDTTLELPVDSDRDTAENLALALPSVNQLVGERKVRNVIVVPNRIVNVVV